MKTKITAIVFGLLIALTGCAASPSTVDPAETSDPAPQETSSSADADFSIEIV